MERSVGGFNTVAGPACYAVRLLFMLVGSEDYIMVEAKVRNFI